MPKITLDEFCSHWVSRTSTRVMASRLEFNVFDFATAAGDYTRQQFVSSFASGGFNGSKWAPRTSKWGKRFTHPLMNDTGTLARSIQSERHSGTAFRPYAHLPERRQVLHVDYGKELSSQGQAGTQQGALRALCRHTQYRSEVRAVHGKPVFHAPSRTPAVHRILTEDGRLYRRPFHRYDF